MTTDLIIIGSGPGGYRTAEYAAKNGLQVVIFERKHAGGTCLNSGCIPTKTLCHEASLEQKEYQQALVHKNSVVEQLRTGVEQLMTMPGITFVRGTASFKDDTTVTCNGEEYTAQNIIIATGSAPSLPPFVPSSRPLSLERTKWMSSTELLDLDHVPGKLVIVGAGVVGMEFACIFNRFGSQVTIIEYMKECLPAIDSDIAKRLRKTLEKSGIEFYMQSAVEEITNEGVVFKRKEKRECVAADVVLVATGRQPNINSLQLDAAHISYTKKGIDVDDKFMVTRTAPTSSDTRIYAIGDVNGCTLLAHAATMQGMKVINNILGKHDSIRLDIMPAAVFTTPEVASVGLTEDQCKAQGIAYVCKKGLYRANGKALSMNETEGIVKLIATPSAEANAEHGISGNDAENRIIGCHVMGAHAADLVQEVAALMNFDASIAQLRDIIHIHPTLSEILQSTAESF